VIFITDWSGGLTTVCGSGFCSALGIEDHTVGFGVEFGGFGNGDSA